ncbi:hypothetical protein ACHAWF_007976 [Thalassiosira exigua]
MPSLASHRLAVLSNRLPIAVGIIICLHLHLTLVAVVIICLRGGNQRRSIMSGLLKPVTQRGRPGATRRTRHPAVDAVAVQGGICGSRNQGSPFVSSYAEDKRLKRQRQMRDQMKKWLVKGGLAFVALVVFSMVRSSSDGEASAGLRSGAAPAPGKKVKGTAAVAPPPIVKAPPPIVKLKLSAKAPPPTPKPTAEDFSFVKRPNPECSYAGRKWTGPLHPIRNTHKDHSICRRKVHVKLSDPKTWPTPFTPSLGQMLSGGKEVELLKKDATYGNFGGQLNAFFHAFDVAHDTNRPLYITQDSWAIEVLFTLFFGPYSAVEKNSALWFAVEEALGAKIIENEGVLALAGLKNPEPKPPIALFYYTSTSNDAEAIRNHRDTILRKLFQYVAQHGETNVCSTIGAAIGKDPSKKYTAIHIAEKGAKGYLAKLNGFFQKDHTAASEMRPEYVKSILKDVEMLQQDIYLVHSQPADPDVETHGRLAKDPDLSKHMKEMDYKLSGCIGGNFYLSVLADVYLGNPVDQTSLWVARMRMALGMKNTFIFTEKKGDGWVSYLDEKSYLDLYDRNKLGGPWMG